MKKLISAVLTAATLLIGFVSTPALAQGDAVVITSRSAMVPDKLYQSNNRLYSIVFQSSDGNLVIYIGPPSNRYVLWSAGTIGGKAAAMQEDGNFAVYDAAGNALWNSGTWGSATGGTAYISDRGEFIVKGNGQFKTPADKNAPPPSGPPCTQLRQFPICFFPGRPTQFNSWIEACSVAEAQQRAPGMGASYGRCPGT